MGILAVILPLFMSIPMLNKRVALPNVKSIIRRACGHEYLMSIWYGRPSGLITTRKVLRYYDGFSTLNTRMS